MGIEAFYTQQTPAAAANNGAAKPVSSKASSDAALVFLDALLASMSQKNPAPQEETKTASKPLQSDNPVLAKNPSLATIIATDSDTAQTVEDFILPTVEGEGDQIEQTLVLNQQAFDQVLKPLVDEKIISAETAEKLQTLKISKLQGADTEDMVKDITASLLGDLEQLSAKGQMIVSNLTPEQITTLQKKISDAAPEAQDGVVVTTLIQLMLPADNKQAALSSDNTQKTDAVINALTHPVINKEYPTDPAQLNNMTVGEEGTPRFDDIINNLVGNKNGKQAANGNELMNGEMKAGVKSESATHVLPTLPSLMGMDGANLSTPSDWFQSLPENYGLTPATSSVTSMNNFTNLVGQTQSAAQAHPGTQIVAATLQKFGQDGANKSITLQLDPPELGRVEVKMSFAKDKSMKTVLTIEKPETLAMLQRDAHSLERAMTDIGLDADGSLSFELATGDHSFNQDGGHDGSRNGYKNSGSGEEQDNNIIQSTMTWHVDPNTGHMRYDILA